MRCRAFAIACLAVALFGMSSEALGHEEYGPGAFVRARAGYLQPTQDFSSDYAGGFVGMLGLGYFMTPAVRLEGAFMYTIPIDPAEDSTASGDLMVLGGEGSLGYELSSGSDATPYIEVVSGYYSFNVEEEPNSREPYGEFGVGAGVGMIAYPEFFSGSLDLAVHYRYIFSNEDESTAQPFLEKGFNNSFLTFTVGIGLYF